MHKFPLISKSILLTGNKYYNFQDMWFIKYPPNSEFWRRSNYRMLIEKDRQAIEWY